MASEEDVLLREVDEDLSRDETFERLRKYQVPLIGAAVAVIAGVTGWQFYDSRQEAAANAAAEAYAPLSFAAETDVAPAELATFARENDSGYAVLAALRAAGGLGAEGNLEEARDLYASVYADSSASISLRDYARIRAGYLLFDNRPEEAADIAAQVETTAFRPFAEEITSGAAMKAGDYAAARAGFKALANSQTAPQSLKARAEAYAAVADAALNGASLEPDMTPESFIDRFGAELNAAGAPTGQQQLPPLPNLDLLTGDAPATAEDAPAEEEAQADTPSAPSEAVDPQGGAQ